MYSLFTNILCSMHNLITIQNKYVLFVLCKIIMIRLRETRFGKNGTERMNNWGK